MSEDKPNSEAIMTKDVSISWHAMSNTDVLERLETPLEDGLSLEEVKTRQEKYGPPQAFGRCSGRRSTAL